MVLYGMLVNVLLRNYLQYCLIKMLNHETVGQHQVVTDAVESADQWFHDLM